MPTEVAVPNRSQSQGFCGIVQWPTKVKSIHVGDLSASSSLKFAPFLSLSVGVLCRSFQCALVVSSIGNLLDLKPVL